jgi:hypothetical protein
MWAAVVNSAVAGIFLFPSALSSSDHKTDTDDLTPAICEAAEDFNR